MGKSSFSRIQCVTDYLDRTVLLFPNKTAIVDGDTNLTFKELKICSMSVARLLEKLGLFKQPIVVFMEKCHECVESFIGIAYSGNFYVPIDVTMPDSRISKILEVLHPMAVITKLKYKDRAETIFSSATVVTIDAIDNDESFLECKNSDKRIDTDILYVLFTSGSTGIPKGVTICHRSVIDYTEWVTQKFNIDENHIFGNQAPFYFDNSILDIYQMLKTGATMNIIPEGLFSFPMRLLEYIRDNRINIIFWVPSALCLVANLKALGKVDISCLSKILFCGEVMPVKQLNMWRKILPHTLFANLYGPTEITDVCTYYIVDREFEEKDSLPIGYACENTDIIVLNDEEKLVSENEIGELCVRGTSLSLGYYNNPEKTKQVFVQNPLNNTVPEIIYRTGDLVKYNEYGELLYCSRKDFQIKHMGHRIELGEIETAVSSLDEIQQGCCLYDEIKKKIVLFYVGNIEGRTISNRLSNLLPEYMIPNSYKQMPDLPINLNGKIDRVALKSLL